MRDRVAQVIDKRVNWRVQQHMKAFRKEVDAEINDQTEENKEHITHYQTVNK